MAVEPTSVSLVDAGRFSTAELDATSSTPSRSALSRLPRFVAIAQRVLPIAVAFDEEHGNEILWLVAAQANRLTAAHERSARHVPRSGVRIAPPASPDPEADEAVLAIRTYSQSDRLVFTQVDPAELQKRILAAYGAEPPADPDPHVVFAVNLLRDVVYRRFTDLETEPVADGGVIYGMVDQEWIVVHRFGQDERSGVTIAPEVARENYDRFIRVIKTRAAGPNMSPGTENIPQDGQFQIALPHRTVDTRVNVMPMRHRESLWARLHDLDLDVASPERLGMPKDVIAALDDAFQIHDVADIDDHDLSQPRGIIAYVGPQRTGKTTTVESYVVHRLLPRGLRCAIVANPIEREIEGIAQFEVSDRGGMSWSAISRALKRRRYNFTFIAEGRDHDSVNAAFSEGGTGGLTGLTIHAPDCLGLFPKLSIEFKIPVSQQAETIKLVISQRLVRRLCGDCKIPVVAAKADRATSTLVKYRPAAEGRTVFVAGGCALCNGTGYRRELAVFEKFRPTQDFWEALQRGMIADQLYAIASQHSYRPMFEHGLDRVIAGETSFEEVALRVPKP